MAVQRSVAAPRLDHSIVATSSGLCRKTHDHPNTYSLLTRNTGARVRPFSLYPCQPCHNTFPDHGALELGKHHAAAGRRRGVETLLRDRRSGQSVSTSSMRLYGSQTPVLERHDQQQVQSTKILAGRYASACASSIGGTQGRANGAGGSRGVFATNKKRLRELRTLEP